MYQFQTRAIVIILLYAFNIIEGGTRIKIMIIEEDKDFLAYTFSTTLHSMLASRESSISFTDKVITLQRHDEEFTFQRVCEEFREGTSLLLDFTWTGWKRGKKLAQVTGVPYLKAGITIHPFLRVVDDTLTTLRNATNAVFIFENHIQLRQSLYYLIEYSTLRVLALDGLNKSTLETIANMLPMPSFVVLIADSLHSNDIFSQAMRNNLIKMDDRWNLVFTDFNYETFHRGFLSVSTTKYKLKKKICSPLAQLQDNCACPKTLKVTPAFLQLLSKRLVEVFENMVKNNDYSEPNFVKCGENGTDITMSTSENFYRYILEVNKLPGVHYSPITQEIYPHLEFQITGSPSTPSSLEDLTVSETKIADWDTEAGLQTAPGLVVTPARRFFRIGTAAAPPYSYPVIEPTTGKTTFDKKGNEVWDGYCIDFIKRLAKEMNFEYEIVISNKFGAKSPNGSWNGLVGDLRTGLDDFNKIAIDIEEPTFIVSFLVISRISEHVFTYINCDFNTIIYLKIIQKTDMIVAALTMTSEREQVVDFVTPYYEQSGFSIVIRKPVRKISLFKFMTVLRWEVWLSILLNVTITGIAIWFIDTSSPFSAQNNDQIYSHTTRRFTLKESFWFALTSFTPLGGGEAPKSLSCRILVASYWMFVILMNSTFTANLAAFLTVERMQTPVESLTQLAQQSRITYSVVENEDPYKYFTYMRHAEETLLRLWKDISLNITSTQTQYRVWDYPVKDFYALILKQIEKTGIIPNSSYGFQKVLDSEEGEFALIHDTAEIQFNVAQNCNLTEVGEMFAVQPYAVAVPIDSDIKKEISRKILELQKEGFFDYLKEKFWNSSNKGTCTNVYDTEGVTLESLGGVFIATFFGLALAVIGLCGEIIHHKHKNPSDVLSEQLQDNVNYGILSRKEFGISLNHKTNIIKPDITYVTVMPRSQLY